MTATAPVRLQDVAPPLDILPYGRPFIDDDDIAAVCAVLRSQWLTTGPAVEAFEAALAAEVGAADAVACASGTAALHLACLALGLGPGDGLIVPAITFAATANCARFVGAEAIFADVDPETGLMEAEHVAAAAGRAIRAGIRPRAVAPVHFAGQLVDLQGLRAQAADLDLAVVEDACHALGAAVDSEDGAVRGRVGACDDSVMTVFSFHPVKSVTMGEGGAVTTNDPALARRLRDFRGHGITRNPAAFADTAASRGADGRANPWYYEMADIGFNYRASDIACALGRSQLDKLAHFVASRRAIARRYESALAPLAPLFRPLARCSGRAHAWHLYVVRIDFAAIGCDRATLMRSLAAVGIGSQVHYIPLHRQPYYRRRYGEVFLPGAEQYYSRCLSLPLFVGLGDGDIQRIVRVLADTLATGCRP
ncbi:MAG: UDP-4-amino-4,6-dideoxy-N-acetyl-beta-L-altrosamine transaminase [Rhodospirillales bacterium]|nr:UDP-4-amino-4,6-dideoxy-N-acetyl-beta-L-altrosamine transaminase [Rhodospirillales bacterium]